MASAVPNHPASNTLITLLSLGRKARQAVSPEQLRFLLANDTHALCPYRQALIWDAARGVETISGVVQVEANAPFVLWAGRAFSHWVATKTPAGPVDLESLPPALRAQWGEWLPSHAYWLPWVDPPDVPNQPSGGLLLARDLPWTENEGALLREWVEIWQQSVRLCQPSTGSAWADSWRIGRARSRADRRQRTWWRRPAIWGAALGLALAFLPVRLSVFAPGELVPAHPAVVRSPLDGLIAAFHVKPNEAVRQGQLLFEFDEVSLRSRLNLGEQAVATAEAEYRQAAQQALIDPRYKASLVTLAGRVEERRVDLALVRDQIGRARVTAPQDGIALFDDPTEWIGRPVRIGERIMRLAATGDAEVEAWLPLADAIPLPDAAPVSLFLNASPLDPVRARVRYLAHDAVARPDGSYAYRLRATIEAGTSHRVGLKGTARVDGRRVPLLYWVFRRPWAAVRIWAGY